MALRFGIDFNGIGEQRVTVEIDNSTITYEKDESQGTSYAGRAVTMAANKTIALADDGEAVVGRLITVQVDNKATMQFGGFMSLPKGQGATLTLGGPIVGALGAGGAKGYVRDVDTAVVAELAAAKGSIIDTSGTTDAWVVY